MAERSYLKLPYLVDPHVHDRFDQPHKEDWDTLEAACLAGGVLQKIVMPNNSTLINCLPLLEAKIASATPHLLTDTFFHLGTWGDRWNNISYSECYNKVSGLKVYMNETTGGYSVNDLANLVNIFSSWPTGKPILVHAEGAMLAVALGLARIYSQRLYICHVSKAHEVDLIEAAKESGQEVFAEVTPHHLLLTDYSEGKNPFKMMKPPLGGQDDRAALWDGLDTGVIDVVATDHAPHTKEEKRSAKPPSGVPGLETTLPLLLNQTRRWGSIVDLDKIALWTHTNPIKIFDLQEQPESFVEVDTKVDYLLTGKDLQTKCKWTPFEGLSLCDRIYRVTLRGKVVFEDGQILA